MTITPEQARELLDVATPGPWGRTGMGALTDTDGKVLVNGPDGNMDDSDADLAAAAPDLAQTIAGMRWEYGVEQAIGTTQWFRSLPMAEAHAEVRGAFRLVRRLVGPVDVTE